jgi:hypothetical protein
VRADFTALTTHTHMLHVHAPRATCLQKHMRPGCYLWELIHPKDKEGAVMRSAAGRYRVKLFLLVRAVKKGGAVQGLPPVAWCARLLRHAVLTRDAHVPRLLLQDTWRSVVVDDRIPVDLFGEHAHALLGNVTCTWHAAAHACVFELLVSCPVCTAHAHRAAAAGGQPLSKAVLKVMATYRSLDAALPSQVSVACVCVVAWPLRCMRVLCSS